jgi:hypothetical protein
MLQSGREPAVVVVITKANVAVNATANTLEVCPAAYHRCPNIKPVDGVFLHSP